jgi:polysaccharide biosynthesis transport protein
MNVIAMRRPGGEASVPPEDDGELGTISLKWLFAFLVRRWILIAVTGAIVFIAAFTGLMIQKPQYTATALVMINAGQEVVLNPQQQLNGGPAAPPTQVVDSQLEVLRSRMLAGRLTDDLGLVNDPEWNAFLTPGRAANAAGAVAQTPAQEIQIHQDVVEAVGKAIAVNRRGLTFAAEVNVTSQNPERAAEMSNRLVELFQQYQLESRLEATERANTWLTNRLQVLREDVQNKEEAVETYRAANGLISSQGTLLSEQQTTELLGSVMQARADLAEKEARYAQLLELMNTGGNADTIASVLNSAVISQLRQQEAEVARRQADMESRYADTHPALVNVRAEREDIRAQITAEVGRIASGMRNDVDIARTRLSTLQGSMDSMRGQLEGNNEQMVRLRELEREATASRNVYEAFLQRYHEIADQGTMRAAPAELISPATIPAEPSSPRLSISFVIAFGLALALGLMAGFIAEALDEGFVSAEDLERKTGAPALASIPQLRRRELRQTASATQHPSSYLLERQMSAFTEAFRVLRTTILFAAGQPKTQVVAVTSALPGEGKSTVSLCLSRVAALSGQRVLLIDCDLRRRSLKEVLDIEPPVGLLQVLAGEADWRQAVFHDEASGMSVLPLSGWGFTPKEIFGAEDMSRLLAELRTHFDLIVLDCAPVLAVAETRVAVAKADCAVMVTRWQKTPLRAVRSALQQLHDAGANIRGVALNGVDRRAPGYYSYPTYDFSET